MLDAALYRILLQVVTTFILSGSEYFVAYINLQLELFVLMTLTLLMNMFCTLLHRKYSNEVFKVCANRKSSIRQLCFQESCKPSLDVSQAIYMYIYIVHANAGSPMLHNHMQTQQTATQAGLAGMQSHFGFSEKLTDLVMLHTM